MILVWGLPGDAVVRAVRGALAARGAAVAFVDQRESLDAELELEVGVRVAGRLRLAGGAEIDLAQVRAAYIRPDDASRLPAIERAREAGGDWQRALALQAGLMAWSEVTPALVVNRPAAMASNCSKPYQSQLIGRLGFRVPETLVTTDPAAARAFWRLHGDVIYKSVSGVRSVVARLSAAHEPRLGDVASCPTQFQRWIPGVDHRVHVVGDAVLACAVHSDAVDYRYGGHAEIVACELPGELVWRCRALARGLGLAVAGIDLRRTPEGEWFCFEVNPSPGFTYYDSAFGGAIAHAVAALLTGADAGPAPDGGVRPAG